MITPPVKRFAGTGHRPDELGGYNSVTDDALLRLAVQVLSRHMPTEVITGMAQGWDTALALACERLTIPFIAAVPFKTQDIKWPSEARQRYKRLLSIAKQVVFVDELYGMNPGYDPRKMHMRNEWMVIQLAGTDDRLLALYNGKTSGGTYACVRFAKSRGKAIINVWPEWEQLTGPSTIRSVL